VDSPCRNNSGGASATFGLLRHHGGRITERNRTRSPGHRVDTAVVDPRRPDRHRTSRSDHLAPVGMAVADDQPPTVLVPLGHTGGQVGGAAALVVAIERGQVSLNG
jgi:hypothetical protein